MDKKNMDIDSLFEKTQEKKALKQQSGCNLIGGSIRNTSNPVFPVET